jgi:hypothetical protein
MHFEHSETQKDVGTVVGFALSYLLFTTILFFVLAFAKKIPAAWTWWHISAITAAIVIIGALLKRWLR